MNSFTALPEALLFFSLSLLLFASACGGSHGPTTPPVTGNFSNASLNGSYAFTFQGTNVQSNGSTAPFTEAGVFTADGGGGIISGTVDFMQGNFGSTGVTGNYSLHNDGTGNINLNFTSSTGAIQFGVTLIDSSHVYLIETDATSTGFGLAEKQDTTAFATPPSGTFVFRLHANSGTASSANVGVITSTGGALNGTEDVLRGGVVSQLTLTGGTFNTPDTSGRAPFVVQDSSGGAASNFEYYVVNANTFVFLETDSGVLAVGRAEKQSAASFSNTSLKGGFAFGSLGDTSASGMGAAHSVGAFSADGNGNITSGSYDSVQDGNVISSASLSGTYAVATNGRATATLSLNGTSTPEIFWMVSPSRVFFLINSSTRVEDGTIDQQQAASFSNTNLNGQYAFVMDGFDSTSLVDRVGTLKTDGSGNLTLNEVINRLGIGVQVPGFLAGTYSVGSNGRVTASISTVSSGLVFYVVSSNKAYLLQADPSTEISGQIGLQ